MIHNILKAKRWQLALAFTLPYLLYFLLRTDSDQLVKFTPIITALFLLVLLGWLYSIGVGLQKKTPKNLQMKTLKFKVFMLIPLIYVPFMLGFMDGLFDNIEESDTSSILFLFLSGFLLHGISIFGLIYSYYFTAKTIKTIELNREVRFSDFQGILLQLVMFPVGIWFIQPKINKMVE
tara:strand:- start:4166 stop:4699 length:534 start_codon:yes stop_codon:yes gene_type:complete